MTWMGGGRGDVTDGLHSITTDVTLSVVIMEAHLGSDLHKDLEAAVGTRQTTTIMTYKY